MSLTACSAPSGAVADDTDCDDSDSSTYPAAAETCYDGVVNDCDGTEADALAQCTLTGDLDTDDATWAFEGDAGDQAGAAVTFEDLDGDGDLDMAVGAPGHDSDAGAVYVVLDPGSATSNVLSDGDLILEGSASTEGGYALAWWDGDGDGDDDLIVGAPTAGGYSYGGLHLVPGPLSATGTASLPGLMTTTKKHANCGERLTAVGDLNGDGDTDLSVSCLGWDSSAGKVLLFTGPLSGVSDLSTSADHSLVGDASGQNAGASVTAADLNGDGQDDWIIGAYAANSSKGAAWVFNGPISGDPGPGDADLDLRGVSSGGKCAPVTTLDHNGDGSADLVVGCPGSTSTTGYAYVLNGSLSATASLGSANATISASKVGFGTTLASAGDLDGDGYDDLLVAAPSASAKAGTTYFFYGPFSASMTSADADATLTGTPGTSSGDVVFGDFDGNGDGLNEVGFTGIGAANTSGSGNSGAVYLYSGAEY